MKPKYCLPIIKSSAKDTLSIITEQEKCYDFIEVWLDYIEDFSDEFLQKITQQLGSKLIVLFRRQNLESIHMSTSQRQTIIKGLARSNTSLDLDIGTQQDELVFINDNIIKLNLITSYHNYKETPSLATLKSVVTDMQAFQPSIFKIATYCKTEEDAVRLLQLQQSLKEKHLRHIILGMGENGTITRIFCTLWGNEMIFAPMQKDQSSAPGQLTKEELESIFDILED